MELKLGPIPVRIQGIFFVMAALLGASERDPLRLAVWVAVVLVSVVLHELGHALMGRAFGLSPSIVLNGMGGLTSFEAPPGRASRGQLGTARSIAISLAGPFAGFAVGGALLAARSGGLSPESALGVHVLAMLVWVNIGWGIFNLLPMLPLDGGNVMRATARAVSARHGDSVAHVLSIGLALAVGIYALTRGQWWIVYLGAIFVGQNVQGLRQLQRAARA